jgi:hypothetical protein
LSDLRWTFFRSRLPRLDCRCLFFPNQLRGIPSTWWIGVVGWTLHTGFFARAYRRSLDRNRKLVVDPSLFYSLSSNQHFDHSSSRSLVSHGNVQSFANRTVSSLQVILIFARFGRTLLGHLYRLRVIERVVFSSSYDRYHEFNVLTSVRPNSN